MKSHTVIFAKTSRKQFNNIKHTNFYFILVKVKVIWQEFIMNKIKCLKLILILNVVMQDF